MEQNQDKKLFSFDVNQANTDSKEEKNKNYENKPIDIELSNYIFRKESEQKTLFGEIFKKEKLDENKSLFDNNQSLFGNYEKKVNKNKIEEKNEQHKRLFSDKEENNFFKNSGFFGNTNLFGEKIDESLNQNKDKTFTQEKEQDLCTLKEAALLGLPFPINKLIKNKKKGLFDDFIINNNDKKILIQILILILMISLRIIMMKNIIIQLFD